jgi:hypothetical protein
VCKEAGGGGGSGGDAPGLRGGAAAQPKGACAAAALPAINSCAVLRQHFDCAGGCVDSMGSDQPAHIAADAPRSEHVGACLVNTDRALFSCQGRYPHAERLCTCLLPAAAGA